MKIFLFLLFANLSISSFAQTTFEKPERGFYSEKPAERWEDALLSGNGTMGIMVMGEPYDETIIVNHAQLYRPNQIPDSYLDQAARLHKIRKLLQDGNYKGACDEVPLMREECEYNVTRDPFITGFDVRVSQLGGTPVSYQRGVNYQTAETFAEWKDEHGYTIRKVFVSRKDSVIALVIESDHKINCTLSFEKRNQQDKDGNLIEPDGFKSMKSGYNDGWFTFKALYAHTNKYNPYTGYEGVGKAFIKGGNQYVTGNKLVVMDADKVTLLVKISPTTILENSMIPVLKKSICSISANYKELVERNIPVHNTLFSVVRLDLNASLEERSCSSEEEITKAMAGEVSLSWIEKVFDAGRYNIICCTGTNPPNLQGLWSGTWSAAWSGSFTTNGNLPTAISFLLSGNTPSLMKAYFNQICYLMDGFRKSQQALFGMRGFHIPAQMTMSPLVTDTSRGYPHSYWTGGAGWAAWQFFDYYQYTGDKEFLKKEAYPLMKEAAAFYEDFLTMEDENGKYIFSPSYSPENAPGGERGDAASINATMDVMIAKQLLRSCIKAARTLHCDKKEVVKWNKMLAKMPEYQITQDGYFREWLWKDLSESNRHRHASHLYALYDELAPEFKDNQSLCKAVSKTIDARMEMRRQHRGWVMAFGMAQMGMAAAHIGDTRLATECIEFLSRYYWAKGMASYHDPGGCFNMDISGGLPYVISQTLAYSELGYLKVLPALPEHWRNGTIEGLLLRGNVILSKLSWSEKEVYVELCASETGKQCIEWNGQIKTIQLERGQTTSCVFER